MEWSCVCTVFLLPPSSFIVVVLCSWIHMKCVLLKSILLMSGWLLRLVESQLHIISRLFRVKVFFHCSFHVYGLIWWSFSEHLLSTSHVPWRAPIGMYFGWWTFTNISYSVLSKASWFNHGIERERECKFLFPSHFAWRTLYGLTTW